MNGEWTIDQVAGTRKQITKPKVKLTTSGFSTLQAAVSATTEFLPPTGLDTMAADATT